MKTTLLSICSYFILTSFQIEKIPIAIIDLDANGISISEVKTLTDRLRNELFYSKKFQVLEREKMEEILVEQGFQQSGCTSNECLVEAGKLINVKHIIGGSVGKVGQTYTVSLRMIDVEKGKIISIATQDYKGQIDGLLTFVIPKISKEITGESFVVTKKEIKKEKNINYNNTESVTDIDGNVYKIIKIGSQWWMAENLKVTHYRNGDAIPIIKDDEDWINHKIGGAYCVYENDYENILKYGLLYNGWVVNDKRKIAPEGWHVPSEPEWRMLIDFLGGNEKAGGRLKDQGLKYWSYPNTGASNNSGFTALPSGQRHPSRGFFNGLKMHGGWWSSTPYYSEKRLWFLELNYNQANIRMDAYHNNNGFSIRCVKDY
ncbi:MAG: hypothetical protein KDF60_14985 [Calditrichaeota bacterium]|nr:hypothetical protein [Calditrichota bacterium]